MKQPRSLAEQLRGWSAEQLAALMARREDLAVPPPHDISELAERASAASSARRAVDQLDVWQMRVCRSVAAMGSTTSLRRLAALLDQPQSAVRQAIAQLTEVALVWGSEGHWHCSQGVHTVLGPYPAGLAGVSAVALSDDDIDRRLTEADESVLRMLQRLVWNDPVGQAQNAQRRGDGDTPVDVALSLGLLRPASAHTVVLPREVSLRMRGGRLFADQVTQAPPPWARGQRSSTVSAGLGSAGELLRHSELIINDISERNPQPTATGGWRQRDLARLGALVGSLGQAKFLVSLLEEARLLRRQPGTSWMATTDYDAWLRDPDFTKWVRLRDSWALVAPETLRRMALSELQGAPDDSAVTAEYLATRLQWLRPAWTDALTESPVAPTGEDISVAELIRWASSVIEEWSWLGCIALGQRTQLAVATTDPGFPLPVSDVFIQGDLTVIAPGPVTREVAEVLGLTAELISTGGGAVRRFTAASIRRALDAGWMPEELHGWLSQHSVTDVPQPLSYLIDDVARRHGAIRIQAVASVAVLDDPATAEHLLSLAGQSELGLRRVAPGVLVAAADPHELLEFLRAAGHAPTVQTASGGLATTPAPRRARTPGGPSPGVNRSDLRQIATALLARDDPARQVTGANEIIALLERNAGSGGWLDIDHVSDQGTPSTVTARVIAVASGRLKMIVRGAGPQVIALSRLLAARQHRPDRS